MKYANGKRTIVASPKAFEVIYKEQGFKPCKKSGEAVEKDPTATAETVTDVTKMDKRALLKIATKKGIEGASSLTKDELVAVLKDVI